MAHFFESGRKLLKAGVWVPRMPLTLLAVAGLPEVAS
jgi:hypothetical protein